jgi:hypothetical protein
MRKWKLFCSGLALTAALAAQARAQIPGAPGIPGVPGVPSLPPGAPGPTNALGNPLNSAAAPVGVPAMAPSSNLWSWLCPTAAQKQACKDKLCALPLFQLLSNGLAPASALTGGVISGCCPNPNAVSAADLAKPADSAEGAAARVKADEADAKARRAAVRYLSTAECVRWPEVQQALINSLRADKNECVRLEAAWAFTRGCCCNRPVIRALTLTVSGSIDDGNPPETSERVKAAAHAALDHCLSCYSEIKEVIPPVVPEVEKRKEGPKGEGPGTEGKTSAAPSAGKAFSSNLVPVPMDGIAMRIQNSNDYYRRVDQLTTEQVVNEARRVREHLNPASGEAVSFPTGERSMFGLFQHAASAPSMPATTAAPTMIMQSSSAPIFSAAPPTVVQTSSAPIVSAAPPTVAGMTTVIVEPTTVVTPSSGSSVGVRSIFTAVPNMFNWSSKSTPTTTTMTPTVITTPTVTTTPSKTTVAPVIYETKPTASVTTPTVPVVKTTPIKDSNVTQASASIVTAEPKSAPSKAAASMKKPSSTTPTPSQLLVTLREAAQVEQRVWAADVLGACDGWSCPKVVEGLVNAARTDKSAAVRAVCVHSLARMNVRTLSVLSTVQALKNDSDAKVRTAAEQALRTLSNEPVAMR